MASEFENAAAKQLLDVPPEASERGTVGHVRKSAKTRICMGYLPMRPECLPLTAAGKVDWAAMLANIFAGLVIGVREALGGIVSASLIFSSSDIRQLSDMFPFGIGMIWYSTAFGVIWYALFGRLQYAYGTAQDVTGILQASMIASAAHQLRETPCRIPATCLAIIQLSAVLTGICSFVFGKCGLGKYMLLFPAPVTSGFLGSIGFVILRNSFQTSSGVKFRYFYPTDWAALCSWNSLSQVACQLAMVWFIRRGPALLHHLCPRSVMVLKLSGVICQLLPLALFYILTMLLGISMTTLTESGWTYPQQGSPGALDLWSKYSLWDVDTDVVLASLPDMPAVVLMAMLCTAAGALSITDRFPVGPKGDPTPQEFLDFDMELTTVGTSDVLLGLTGGTLTFHTFTAIQLRLDGGTHRIAVLSVAAVVGGAFASGAPLGHIIPKWFLSGLFLNTAIHFLKHSILSYRSLPMVNWHSWKLPNPQYLVTLSGILVSVWYSPTTAIAAGLCLSITQFLVQSARESPVINVVVGDRVVSRTMRPYWEMRTLRKEGHRIILIYLQGHLFFGSVRRLVAALSAAAGSGRVQYCIVSFARVPHVDASAARHFKVVKDRLKSAGVDVLCCRMNRGVYSALFAAGVVTAPDAELVKHLKGLRWKGALGRLEPENGTNTLHFPTPHCGEPDAFPHETDALDYCDNRIVAEFCYGPGRDFSLGPLDSHMIAYRAAVTEGKRLDEASFEDMNGLSRGLMERLRPHCHVEENVEQWQQLQEAGAALYFILRGAVSMVQMLPHVEAVELEPDVRGFTFRDGKRLHKRYPPGYVIGKKKFFLLPRGQVVDTALLPKVIISSNLGVPAEIWTLRREDWAKLPEDLQGPLLNMLCVQMADEDQHSQLQEH